MFTKFMVWWIPQIPMTPFEVAVDSIAEGRKLLRVLADYDKFQLEHRIKPDYCNVGGLNVWDPDADGEGNGGWLDYDEVYEAE